MRISDWSSDVCSSDLKSTMPSPTPAHRPAWRGWATMTEADKNGESLYPPMQSAEIRRVRQDSGLSQAGFARLLVTHKRTVQRWENGTKRTPGASLALLTLESGRAWGRERVCEYE